MDFAALGLSQPLLRAIDAEGYSSPTPIQTQAIPHLLAGRDIVGCAQTGTGKTAAFALPALDLLAKSAVPGKTRSVRALVLTPTRELAAQIGESFRDYGRHLSLRSEVVFGGIGIERQLRMLKRVPDILVATPGRLLDLLNQGALTLSGVEILILDEADRMLDMGFIHDVKRIVRALPAKRQTVLFSATMPNSIRALADSLLRSPVNVAVTPVSSVAQTLDQSVCFVDKADKHKLLAWVLRDAAIRRALAFTRTKHGANRVVEQLAKSGVAAAAIHGNKSQSARERALEAFKRGQLRVLVATDIAARGIDIDQLSHVINFDLPNVPETYVHRIGRSGRAGAVGAALSFCAHEERPYLRSIERLVRSSLRVVDDHPHIATDEASAPTVADEPRAQRGERAGAGNTAGRAPADHPARKRRHGGGGRRGDRESAREQDGAPRRMVQGVTAGGSAPSEALMRARQPHTAPKPGFSPPRRGARTRQGGLGHR